ncbi:hypothetical protein MRX96_045564 [Rhipicephalus microplus]
MARAPKFHPTANPSCKTSHSRRELLAKRQNPCQKLVSGRMSYGHTDYSKNQEYLKIIEENRLLKASLAEANRELAALKQYKKPEVVVDRSLTKTSELSEPIQNRKQLADIRQQIQLMFAKIHTLKRQVQESINSSKPKPSRTLREWYKAVNGDPGFTSESFEFIKNIVQGRDEPLVAAIMVDDMSIKKHVQLVGNKVFGYVDLGMEMPDDSLPEATNACVFMLVALNMRLKVPLGYFFIILSLVLKERS